MFLLFVHWSGMQRTVMQNSYPKCDERTKLSIVNYQIVIQIFVTTVLINKSFFIEEYMAMEQDDDGLSVCSSSANHGYAMDTLSAVCTEESVVRDVIPVILQHGKNLADSM
jgi:hypothetical protein